MWYSRAAESRHKLRAGICPRKQAGAPWGTSLPMKTGRSHFNLEVRRDRKEQEDGKNASTLGLMDLGPDLDLGLGPGPGLGVLSSLLLAWRVNQEAELVLKSRWDKIVTAQLNRKTEKPFCI